MAKASIELAAIKRDTAKALKLQQKQTCYLRAIYLIMQRVFSDAAEKEGVKSLN